MRPILRPIGRITSSIIRVADAPNQGDEGAPDAELKIDPEFVQALMGISAGDQLIVITWFDRADRSVLQVHPQGNPKNPLAGVFATRSPHRPNPLGVHRVTVRSIDGTSLRVGPIEAIDGTPVVDIKIALDRS